MINASRQTHPMHLHGFYYRVDSYAGPSRDPDDGGVFPGQMVVTQFMSGFSGMSMTWSPNRPGNWLFHCHVALHASSDSLLAAPGDTRMHDMAGLLIGTMVAPRKGEAPIADPAPVRHLLELDGQANPDTIVLHAGRPARFRLMSLASARTPAPTFTLTARPDSLQDIGVDTMLVRWRLVAKDGFDLPVERQTPRPASHRVAIGETYDFEYTPQRPGVLRLEVRSTIGTHGLMVRVPIRVERAPDRATDERRMSDG